MKSLPELTPLIPHNSLSGAIANAQWSLHSEGAMAHRVDHILLFLLIVCIVLAATVFGLMTYFAIRYHHTRTAVRSGAPDKNRKLELSLIAFLLVLLVGLFSWAGKTFYDLYVPPSATYDIYVIGKQWMWKFYGPEGMQGINEIHVPNNRVIRLLMTSEDVIHSFYMPDFHVKQDVLPGQYTTLWFQADQPGRHRILCTQYCGTDHATMGGWMIVDSDSVSSSVPNPHATIISFRPRFRGEQLFHRLQCNSCHSANPSTSPAPDLHGIYGKSVTLKAGDQVLVDENYLRESILDPNAKIVKGYSEIMPSYKGQLSESEILDLVSYIKSLKDSK